MPKEFPRPPILSLFRPIRVAGLACVASALLISSLALAKLETWREDTSAAFTKGKRERVVISENGRVRLGQALIPTPKIGAAHVWDIARSPTGELFVATGDEGKVYRREPKNDAPWMLAYDSSDTQALSLVTTPDGHIFAGTGPTGQVVDVTDPKHPASRPDPKVMYIWDLACDSKGQLFAATGPTGQLWKRSVEGKWSLLLDSKHSHLRCVTVSKEGVVYAGSDGDGLVYRVAADGKASILFDASQNEVTSLLLDSDGTLYAGTASETGAGGQTRTSPLFTGADFPPSSRAGSPPAEAVAAQEPPPPEPTPPRPNSTRPSPGGGTSGSRPVSAGENAVYKIDSEGIAREVFRARALIFALARQPGRLLIGTGPDGVLYEVRDNDHESAPVAKLDHGQILSLLSDPQGNLLIGAGDPAAVVQLASGHVTSGTLVSEVRDAKLPSRFGSLSWRAETPPGTSVVLQVRSGNVGEPDETWSDWSDEQTDANRSKALAPAGRYIQYRATLKTNDPKTTPELHSVVLRYQTVNLAPEVTRIDVPDVSAGDGTARQTRLTLRWEAHDANDDDLTYTLRLRKEGWPNWIRLSEEPLTEKTFSWDTTTVPPGLYRVRVSASDRPSNNPDDALGADRESETFIIDHESPTVSVTPKGRGATITLKDNLTRLTKAAYAVDGADWVSIFPDDGLFDTGNETITLSLPDLKAGSHVLVIRASDAAGNIGTSDALVEVP